MSARIEDTGDDAGIPQLLVLNNENAEETPLLTRERFDDMIAAARVATRVDPDLAFLLAFDRDSSHDGAHFLWFRDRFRDVLSIDRVIVGATHRRIGLGGLLYGDRLHRAERLGCAAIACEVNVEPPNPVSDAFHARMGFSEVGTATAGAKTVRYLLRRA